jgi:hypothetical protein
MPKAINTPPIYQNPYMQTNGFSNIHLNAYMTDTGSVKGPATNSKPTLQQTLLDPPGIGATMAFTAGLGQLVTIRIGSAELASGAPTILLIDPTTLKVLANHRLPQRQPNTSGKISFAGGYFYLDQANNVICVTSEQNIEVYSTDFNKVALGATYGIGGAIATDDILNSVLPDSPGNLWYISHQGGVGYVEFKTHTVFPGNVRNAPGAKPNELITKSFASDGKGRVFVVTDYALYCYQASANGPKNIWRVEYNRGSTMKSGQNQQGSGTTPTCFDDFEGNPFVAITDNADQMNVNVYRRDTGALVAQTAVFTDFPDTNSCENSLIAVNRSIIVENNFGNTDIDSTAGTKTTTPGVNRVDFDPDTKTSSVVWTNNEIAVPSVVSQLSTGDGLIYTYAKDPKGWYWAALDFETGLLFNRSDYVKFPQPEPEEARNNYYAGLTIGPSGAAYLSVFGGLTVWRRGT